MTVIVYLDQNQWVRLARFRLNPSGDVRLKRASDKIDEKIASGEMLLPLTAANIYETFKINNFERRLKLAELQCAYSLGIVFRSREARFSVELKKFFEAELASLTGTLDQHWFLSNLFFEAFGSKLEVTKFANISSAQIEAIRKSPAAFLRSFLLDLPENDRKNAVNSWSTDSIGLTDNIDRRRKLWECEDRELRERAYTVLLLSEEIEKILEMSKQYAVGWASVSEIGRENADKLVQDIPTFDVERRLVSKLELQSRTVNENDLRDMLSYCAAIPYADAVFGERQFISLAKQSKLGERYQTFLSANLEELVEIF